MSLLTKLAGVKTEYDKVAGALRDVRETGYGIVVPGIDELKLEEPEIMKQGGRYGVRLKASAPSIHMIRADIETAVSPIVGNEKQSEDMVNYLLQEFEGDTSKIWQSNIFGRSFHEVVSDDLQTKLKRMPEDARKKLPGDADPHHQRGQRRADLHYPVKVNKSAPGGKGTPA